MKDILLFILRVCSPFLHLKALKRRVGVNAIFPFYHTVSECKSSYLKNAHPIISTKSFLMDLDFLIKNFKPIALSEVQHLNSLNNEQPVFHLTFDDGLRECYDIIAPILLEKGISATFFVNPNFVDNKAMSHRYKASEIIERIPMINATQRAALKTILGRGELIRNIQKINYSNQNKLEQCARILDIDWTELLHKYQPYMSFDQLKELAGKGFSIGAHSMDHPEFYVIEPEAQIAQVRQSVEWLEKSFTQPVQSFAFPFTDWGVKEETLKTIRQELPQVLLFGTAGIKKDAYMWQRIPMENRWFGGIGMLKQEYMYFWLKRFLGKNNRER